MNKTDIIRSALGLVEQNEIKFSVLDIAKDLKTSKRTFYQFFTSKDDLIKAATDFVFDDIERQHLAILQEEIHPIEQLKRVLSVYPSVISFEKVELSDIVAAYPNVAEYISQHFEDRWELTLTLFESCKQQGYLRQAVSGEVFRTIFLGIYEKSILSPNHHALTLQCINAVLEGLLAKE